MSLKAKMSIVATLVILAGVFTLFKNNKPHWVEITVTFTPTPRKYQYDYVAITWSINDTSAHPKVSESPWQVVVAADDNDVVGVTARQSAVSVMGCRIKVDGKEKDHDMKNDTMITCAAVV